MKIKGCGIFLYVKKHQELHRTEILFQYDFAFLDSLLSKKIPEICPRYFLLNTIQYTCTEYFRETGMDAEREKLGKILTEELTKTENRGYFDFSKLFNE